MVGRERSEPSSPGEFYGATRPIAAVERSIRVDGESMSLVSMGTGQS